MAFGKDLNGEGEAAKLWRSLDCRGLGIHTCRQSMVEGGRVRQGLEGTREGGREGRNGGREWGCQSVNEGRGSQLGDIVPRPGRWASGITVISRGSRFSRVVAIISSLTTDVPSLPPSSRSPSFPSSSSPPPPPPPPHPTVPPSAPDAHRPRVRSPPLPSLRNDGASTNQQVKHHTINTGTSTC